MTNIKLLEEQASELIPLIEELRVFCEWLQMDYISADDLLHDVRHSKQCYVKLNTRAIDHDAVDKYLCDYIDRWDSAERAADEFQAATTCIIKHKFIINKGNKDNKES